MVATHGSVYNEWLEWSDFAEPIGGGLCRVVGSRLRRKGLFDAPRPQAVQGASDLSEPAANNPRLPPAPNPTAKQTGRHMAT